MTPHTPAETALPFPVRRLLVDLRQPPARHWNGGDAFRTAFFNALSMSFPVGEQFFIDAVRAGLARLPPPAQDRFAAEVRAFVGQEATHRHVHHLFNTHLASQGLVDHWSARVGRRFERLKREDVRAWLGVTAATEHFTAILAEHLLTDPRALAGAERRLQALWMWHASEESEHRSTAFDLYRALDGNETWRQRLFTVVTLHFTVDLARQTVHNLWRDGSLWQPRTWAQAARFLFGRHGLVPALVAPWRDYRRADFHPSQRAVPQAAQWLQAHAADWRVVGAGAPPV